MSGITLLIQQDTVAKQSTLQSAKLEENDKVAVIKGSRYPVHSFFVDDGHVRAALWNTFLGPLNRNTWYFWAGHVELEGTEAENNPNDRDAPAPIGPTIWLPGHTSPFGLNSAIIPGGNFTWSEATKNGNRIPENKAIVDNIIRMAEVMQDVRELLGGRTIHVTSWYRDPESNRRVGGASRSRHLTGKAVDFWVDGMSEEQAYRIIEPWWGSRGGVARSLRHGFIHLDLAGVKARWDYP